MRETRIPPGSRQIVVVVGGGQPPATERAVRWAMARLVEVLEASGVAARRVTRAEDVPAEAFRIIVTGEPASDGVPAGVAAESFSISRPEGTDGPLVVSGTGARGVGYGLLELADRIACSSDYPLDTLRAVGPTTQRPATPVRSILRTFACEVEDKPWFYDRSFWTEYLTELATQRINRFQLALGMQYNYPHNPATDNYFCFPYPFLLDVPGYAVRAGGLDDEERTRNLETLRFIGDETQRRGMEFQLGLWNHAYDQGQGSRPRYPIEGLTPATHAEYCAAALAELLRQCPSISGLTLRVHYEGGIPEPGHETFWREVMNAVARVGRPIELDLHAKGVDQALLDIALHTRMPIVLGAKHWAEHQGLPYHQITIREKERATAEAGTGLQAITAYQRRFTRYGYGDFLKEDRDYDVLFRIWPGTQKVLLWGDPVLAAGYGRCGTLAGALGIELCEPLTFKGRMDSGVPGGRDLYLDRDLKLGDASWKKYLYTYRLWGRLLYDPDADPDCWRRFLRHEFGSAAAAVEQALGAASRILPLVTVVHGIGASNNGYWPELYLNMPIAGGPNTDHYQRDTAQPPTFGGVSSFDPSLFYRIDEYADDVLAGRRDGRYTPEDTASWLEGLAAKAEQNLAAASSEIADAEHPEFRRYAVDIAVQAGLGRFFAGKTRAGLADALFKRTKHTEHLVAAVAAYRSARDAFASVADKTSGVYRDDLAFGTGRSERGHWTKRLPDIDADLVDLERRLADAQSQTSSATTVHIPEIPNTARPLFEHTPPSTFRPGQAVGLELHGNDRDDIDGIELHYRHLNQGEDYLKVAMTRDGASYGAVIPAKYTDTPYPLAYYFTIHQSTGDAWVLPGLDTDLSNQPYHVLRQAIGRNPFDRNQARSQS